MKRTRNAHVREKVVLALRKAKRATSAELAKVTGCKTGPGYMASLIRSGHVRVADRIHSGRRGRPENVYSLTSRGSMTALNLSKKLAA